MATNVSVGIDIGSQKTMISKDDADIIRTDTGSTFRATLVAFNENERYCGEEAFAHIMGESTVAMMNNLMGKTLEEVKKSDPLSMMHRKVAITSDESNRLQAEIHYNHEKQKLHITSLMGMYIAQLKKRIQEEATDSNVYVSLALPTNHKENPSIERAYREAAVIGGINVDQLYITDASDCLVATYTRKLMGLNPAERAHLENKFVLLVDMGHTSTTAVIVKVTQSTTEENGGLCVEKVAVQCDEALGAYHFDMQLFQHFAAKYANYQIEPGTKKGFRLLTGCERLRKLLSQLPEAQVTVEHLCEDSDVTFALRREELVTLCEAQLAKFRDLLNTLLYTPVVVVVPVEQQQQAGICPGTNLAAIEILGGGARMQIVQHVIHTVCGTTLPLGFKLDDAAVALGAALLCSQALKNNTFQASTTGTATTSSSTNTIGFTETELNTAYLNELTMQAKDYEIKEIMNKRNKLEAYILELRSAPTKKHGKSIDSAQLNALLDEYENWLWDSYHDQNITVEIFVSKYESLHSAAMQLCSVYFNAVEEERLAVEKSLQEESLRAALEKENEGGEEDDHDTRKLKKVDRMRLVGKNKEEGTELFKDGNYRPAAARYHKALTHCSKFFDLTSEDQIEIQNIKLSLYLNLASCYIKLQNWENVLRNCNDALTIDKNNMKALYRRAQYYENKKEWSNSLNDLKLCTKINKGAEDKAILIAIERIKNEIHKEKQKEKKTWGKMFG